jgi:hypothetical protein
MIAGLTGERLDPSPPPLSRSGWRHDRGLWGRKAPGRTPRYRARSRFTPSRGFDHAADPLPLAFHPLFVFFPSPVDPLFYPLLVCLTAFSRLLSGSFPTGPHCAFKLFSAQGSLRFHVRFIGAFTCVFMPVSIPVRQPSWVSSLRRWRPGVRPSHSNGAPHDLRAHLLASQSKAQEATALTDGSVTRRSTERPAERWVNPRPVVFR